MNFLERIESDYKAEVMASQMLALTADFSKILIDRLGHLPRTYTKDVYHSYEDISDVDLGTYTVLQSFRQSIYEAMPESVFHPPTLGGLGKSADEIIDEIKLQRKNELAARKFFKPFEQEAPYLEIRALLMELMYEKKHTYDNLYLLFEQSWPIIRQLPREAALSFIYLLPLLNEVSGKRDWAEKCISFLIDLPVTIRESVTPLSVSLKGEGFVAGNSRLGLTTTFSGQQADGLASWVVHVGPIPKEKAGNILPQSGFETLIDDLLAYFAPANIFIQKIINIDCKEPSTLAKDDVTAARLGYNFAL